MRHAATTGPEGDKNVAQRELYDERFQLGVYKHYKGGLYTAFSVSVDEATLKPMVHYYSHENKTRWTRTMKNFLEAVEPPPAPLVKRFVFIDRVSWQELAEAAGLDELLQGLQHMTAAQVFIANIRR